MLKKILSFAVISTYMPIASMAQSVINDYASEQKSKQDLSGFISAGAAILPEYDGSEDYRAIPILSGQLNKGNYYIATRGLGIIANIIDSRFFNAGPVINFRFGRDSGVKNKVVSRLRSLDNAVEVGAFVSYIIRSSLKQGDNMEFSMRLVQDVAGGHGGMLGKIGASYFIPVNRDLRIGLNTGVDYQDNDYMKEYFSIDANNSSRSGLPQYKASGGFNSASVGAMALYSFTRTWGLVGIVQHTSWLSDASSSPIIKQEGDNSQYFGAVGVTYRF